MSFYKQACHRELELLLQREPNLEAALLCSSDGLPIGYAATTDIEADSLSAISSSMLSLADALAIQSGDKGAGQLISQSNNQTVLLVHAGEDALLALIGNSQLEFNRLLAHAAKEVAIISSLINAHYREIQEEQHPLSTSALGNIVSQAVHDIQEHHV
ncbi:putative regulator of Ras-like GTPase activity, Roadblock/LC7/MglB family [Mariprofundus ferrinatatus]|uniref:Putative regulator of Ras-like GTPase activity, Roadblock/LC7/MglB family n=1 Tax=Mariprofundus ferrinatatus TaxID=1921087 RepID=A0A2K8L6F1_9PROT|nr:roadblock/LC7 domain-containing protein [Mariprofundus ferrinatatus]ATX81829.1 putative regulator of Ras-like GTPase activity, Roadblock/LC7/MglB family [Mariprofundus ferrinatatus]